MKVNYILSLEIGIFSFKKFFLTNMWHDNILSLILFLAAMFIARKNIILAKDL